MDDRWVLDRRAEVSFHAWEDEVVAHHALGNDTHRLSETAGWILARLARAPALTLDELGTAAGCDAEDLRPALSALCDLGFIARL